MHIMLALDQSRYADSILKWMMRFPVPDGRTRLTLVHVLEPLDIPPEFGAKRQEMIRRHQEQQAYALLSRAEEVLKKNFAEVSIVIRSGFPIYEILKLLREEIPDLIVSGTRGLRGATGVTLGSVSQRLLNYAPSSVLLIPLKAKLTRRLRVVLATDGSPGAKTAARLLMEFSDLRDVTLLAAVRPVTTRDLAMHGADAGQAHSIRALLMRGRREAAKRALEETAALLEPSGATIHRRIASGEPADVIPKVAADYDLLVLGSRGIKGMMARAMGSVSLAVAQVAPCPVLVVK